jgi:hypothetical protein
MRERASGLHIRFRPLETTFDSKLDNVAPQSAGMRAAVSLVDFDNDGWTDLNATSSRLGTPPFALAQRARQLPRRARCGRSRGGVHHEGEGVSRDPGGLTPAAPTDRRDRRDIPAGRLSSGHCAARRLAVSRFERAEACRRSPTGYVSRATVRRTSRSGRGCCRPTRSPAGTWLRSSSATCQPSPARPSRRSS